VEPRSHIRRSQIERQAEGYLELGMAQHALDLLAPLRDEDMDPQGWYLRGEALRALERYAEALGPLEEVAASVPDDIAVWLALGWCYKRTGRIDRAVYSMERALKVQPKEALLHYNLACYLSLAGQKERALGHLSKAFAFDPAYRGLVEGERDFDSIRSDPGFQSLVSAVV
jgi:tetratricopeptide (TPR) repeat protein